jgi:hypothetical protein
MVYCSPAFRPSTRISMDWLKPVRNKDLITLILQEYGFKIHRNVPPDAEDPAARKRYLGTQERHRRILQFSSSIIEKIRTIKHEGKSTENIETNVSRKRKLNLKYLLIS